MAIESDYQSQAIAIMDEYLAAAKILLTKRKSDNGVYGYTALLIMLCFIEALDHLDQSVKYPQDNNLSFLAEEPFGLNNNTQIINQIKHWYKNGLSQVGALPENVFIEMGEDDDYPFLIIDSEVKSVSLKGLLNALNFIWDFQREDFTAGQIEYVKEIGIPSPSYKPAH